MHRDVVGQLGGAVGDLDEHAVDATSTLNVLVAADDVALGGLDALHLAQPDVLLERDLELLELGGALADRVDTLGGHEGREGVGLGLELIGAGDEVGLALQLDDRGDVAVDDEADDALRGLAVLALGAGGQALLTQPGLRGFDIATVLLEGLLAVHHPGAGRLAQGLDVLCGE